MPGSKRYIWNIFINILNEKWPDYKFYVNQFAQGYILHACNMFIMSKKIFFEYNEFCFGVLNELDQKIDSSSFQGQEKRFLGFFGEFLLTIFILKQQQLGTKIQYLDAFFIDKPDTTKVLYEFKKFLSFCFAITNTQEYKMLTLCGIKFKLMKRKKINILQNKLKEQTKMIQILANRIIDLEEEIASISK